MDRDKRWERTDRAWNALTRGEGMQVAASNLLDAVRQSYDAGVTDEFLEPMVEGHAANRAR